jgi:hypothetical protein
VNWHQGAGAPQCKEADRPLTIRTTLLGSQPRTCETKIFITARHLAQSQSALGTGRSGKFLRPNGRAHHLCLLKMPQR